MSRGLRRRSDSVKNVGLWCTLQGEELPRESGYGRGQSVTSHKTLAGRIIIIISPSPPSPVIQSEFDSSVSFINIQYTSIHFVFACVVIRLFSFQFFLSHVVHVFFIWNSFVFIFFSVVLTYTFQGIPRWNVPSHVLFIYLITYYSHNDDHV